MAINQLTKCILRAVPDLPQQLDIAGHDRRLLGRRAYRDLNGTVAGGLHSLPWPSEIFFPHARERNIVLTSHPFFYCKPPASVPKLRSLGARLKTLPQWTCCTASAASRGD